MLPAPTTTLTLPSIRDDTALECRIYHPNFSQTPAVGEAKWQRRGAIIAHPYAPLGGCYDNPVVHSIGEVVLKMGFVLGTFNFRGAGSSKGRTSWSAKPELEDYISFAGFFMHYLDKLEPDTPPSHPASPLLCPTSSPLSPIRSTVPTQHEPSGTSAMTLILGGYSYGSLIVANLPRTEDILARFAHVTKGTAAAEIRLRAHRLASQWNSEVQPQRRTGRILKTDSLPRSARSAVFGGDESEPGTRRLSRDSRRSMDAVRRSMDRSVRKLSFRKHSRDGSPSTPPEEIFSPVKIATPHCYYLLVSPLLPPISMFATFFTKLSPMLKDSNPMPRTDEKPDVSGEHNKLTEHPTLAIYGDKDVFTSPRKLRRWAEQLANVNDSRFTFAEITGAGHFWHENRAEARMKDAIRYWVEDLVTA